MIKVMIVDDEALIRNLICNSIDWKKNGFEIIEEAKDGVDALEKLDYLKYEKRPDFMVIDINMPNMDGIKLCEEVKIKYPNIEILILTGFSEFEYAKKAIKIGVSDYILKPIDSKEFESSVVKIKDKIENRKKHVGYIEKLQNTAKKSEVIEKRRLLKALILDDIEKNEKSLLINWFKLNEKSDFYIAIIEIDHLNLFFKQKLDQEVWIFAVSNIADEIMRDMLVASVFEDDMSHIVMILDCQNEEEICSKLKSIKETINNYLPLTATISLSNKMNRPLLKAKEAYNQAIFILSQKFLSGGNRIYRMSKQIEENINKEAIKIDYEKIRLYLETGDRNYVFNEIDKCFSWLSNNGTHEIANSYAVSFVTLVNSIFDESSLLEDILNNSNLHSTKDLINYETLDMFERYIRDLYESAFEKIEKRRGNKNLQVVYKAKTYIEKNYEDYDLSLSSVAKALYVNPSYLSKVFKNQTSYSLVSYLREFRLKEAIDFMEKHPEYNVAMIANEVGYRDALYFSKLFKQRYGLAPKKYMKRKFKKQI